MLAAELEAVEAGVCGPATKGGGRPVTGSLQSYSRTRLVGLGLEGKGSLASLALAPAALAPATLPSSLLPRPLILSPWPGGDAHQRSSPTMLACATLCSHCSRRMLPVRPWPQRSVRARSLPVPSGIVASGKLHPTFSMAVISQPQVPSPPHTSTRSSSTAAKRRSASSGLVVARSITCSGRSHELNCASSGLPCWPPERELTKTSSGILEPSIITSASETTSSVGVLTRSSTLESTAEAVSDRLCSCDAVATASETTAAGTSAGIRLLERLSASLVVCSSVDNSCCRRGF